MKLSLVFLVSALLLSVVLSAASFGSRQADAPLGEFAQDPGKYLNFCVPLIGGCLEEKDMPDKPVELYLGGIQKIGDGAIRSWANVTKIDPITNEEQCSVNRIGMAFNKEALDKLPMHSVSWYMSLPAEVFNESLIDHATAEWHPAQSDVMNFLSEAKLYGDVEYFGFKFWFINAASKSEIKGSDTEKCNATLELSKELLAENFTYVNKCVDQIGAIYIAGDAFVNDTAQQLKNISINYGLWGDKLTYVEVAISKEYLIMLATPGHSDDTGSQSIQPPKFDQVKMLAQFADIYGQQQQQQQEGQQQQQDQQQQEQQSKKGAFPQDFRVRYLTNDLIPGCAQYQLSLDSFQL